MLTELLRRILLLFRADHSLRDPPQEQLVEGYLAVYPDHDQHDLPEDQLVEGYVVLPDYQEDGQLATSSDPEPQEENQEDDDSPSTDDEDEAGSNAESDDVAQGQPVPMVVQAPQPPMAVPPQAPQPPMAVPPQAPQPPMAVPPQAPQPPMAETLAVDACIITDVDGQGKGGLGIFEHVPMSSLSCFRVVELHEKVSLINLTNIKDSLSASVRSATREQQRTRVLVSHVQDLAQLSRAIPPRQQSRSLDANACEDLGLAEAEKGRLVLTGIWLVEDSA
ncbi:hypothetical protein GUITHDRAFT_114768 [Guillardia theta CCMP2712]|uniref:Uncharacterized protein n=1 Tax=Guillardia theta (strain CCMP2712) TaxID=905079 RepID=L1ISM3_GUITC|nr:hypothetical protein GUITHDRAFT_114768 [Guillardia theta CCMP2712]EKX39107.1 hypothetical protein GUITHDRAFT_114768 [Guillardia theta CCMP2712]|eukprot:XP_005826087.1 hypothetical protein GUITHDRAFT_114768 [Guillardia theta CCMP2712]